MGAVSVQGYRRLLIPVAHRRIAVAGLIARLPQAVLGFSALLLVQQQLGSFTTAGLVSGIVVATSAISGPLIGRFADRGGQRVVLRWLAAANGLAVSAFIVTTTLGAPVLVVGLCASAIGLSTLPIGSLTRARWSQLLREDRPGLATAFALEGVLDELVWVGGPAAAAAVAATFGAGWGLALGCAVGAGGSLALSMQAHRPQAPSATEPALDPVTAVGAAPTRPPESSSPLGRLRAQLTLPVLSLEVLAVMAAMLATGVIFGAADISAVALSVQLGRPELAGIALGAGSLGAVVGGLLMGVLAPPRRPMIAVVGSAALVGVGWAPLALTSSFTLVILFCFLGGAFFAPFSITVNRMVEGVSPPNRLTEALAWLSTSVVAGMAMGSAVAGALIDGFGPPGGYLLVAGAAAVPVLVTATAAVLSSRGLSRASAEPS